MKFCIIFFLLHRFAKFSMLVCSLDRMTRPESYAVLQVLTNKIVINKEIITNEVFTSKIEAK